MNKNAKKQRALMVILNVKNVCVEYGTDVVLKDISFSVNDGDKVGLIGVNGAGKSTLAKIIAGSFSHFSGNVFLSAGKTVAMLEQNAMLQSEKNIFDEMLDAFPEIIKMEKRIDELSIRMENKGANEHDIAEYSSLSEKFKVIGGYEYRSKIKSTLERFGFSEIDFSKTINSLSGGERTRLELVKLLLREPDLLILDEPTNHLDIDTLSWLEDHLHSYKKTLIIISHDRYFLDKVTNKIVEIEHTLATLYNGNYSSYAMQKAELRKAQKKKFELQQKEIARIESIIDQQRRWGQEHNFITIKSKQKQIEHIEKVSAPSKDPKSIRVAFADASESGNDVLFAENISKSFGERRILNDINFEIKKRDRFFVIGPNGCGKSTLIRIIGGLDEDYHGQIRFGYNVVKGYYDQELQTLDDNATVLEELCRAHDKLTISEVRGALASFLFFAEDMDKKISVLSGGERARLMLCKMILSKINLLILDEPTNHLDIASREALEDALDEFSGTIIAVSHDRYFIKKLATRIFDMSNSVPHDFNGTYDEYLEKSQASGEKQEIKEKSVSENKQKYLDAKKTAAEKRKNESKITRCESEIEALDEERQKLDIEAAGDAATDYARLTEIYARISEIEARTNELFEEIEQAENALAEIGG